MAWWIDKWRLLSTFYRAAFMQLTKSPSNLWSASAVQIFYYLAQFGFWYGIKSTVAGANFLSSQQVFGFLITLALVDNWESLLLGSGASALADRVVNETLEPMLLWPRHPVGIFAISKPNFSQLPCALLSLVLAIGYFCRYHVSLVSIAFYFMAVLCGIAVLNGISFLHRATVFWTKAIIQVRFSNPSYRIMVRPACAFQGKVKFVLMTLFPALFIVGKPAEFLAPELSPIWVLACLASAILVWSYVLLMWRYGVARYGRRVN